MQMTAIVGMCSLSMVTVLDDRIETTETAVLHTQTRSLE